MQSKTFPSKQLNHTKGNVHEQLASAYLTKKGCYILESNFRSHAGEIDLICQDHDYLVFVEVKYRHSDRYGAPYEAVTRNKQFHICRTSDYYCYTHRISEFTPIRFDVISIYDKQITWIKDAFSYIPR